MTTDPLRETADPLWETTSPVRDPSDRVRERVVVEADGGARGNPGPAGFGALVRDGDSDAVLAERSGSLGVTTNNVAEYTGLIEGLTAATEVGAREVIVRMDSKLVIEQMSGRWQIRHAGLRPLAARAAALAGQFTSVRFEWIPRERNKHADALANRAMDAAAGVVSDRGAPADRAGAPHGSWEPRTSTPTRMILVRHGQTEYTATRRYSGRGDVPLTAVGVAQAEALAARVAALVATGPAAPVAAVVSSPLVRCTATAEAIRAGLALRGPAADVALRGPGAEIASRGPGAEIALRIEPDLIECDFGAWEGLTFSEVGVHWPLELERWLGSPAVAPPAGESFRAVSLRVRRVVTALRAAYPAQTLVVVSHVSPIKVLLRDALAAGDAFLHRLHLDAAGVSIVDSWPDGGVSVRSVNDTSHLQPE